MADNDNARRSNSGARELISPENSLSGQVLTPTQSSMGKESAVLAEQDNWAPAPPTHGLNQDLLSTSNYLNVQCNQPDSESSSGSQFASAKCKQMDPLDSGKRPEGEKAQGALNQARPSESIGDRWPHKMTTISPTTKVYSQLWHNNNKDNYDENNQSEDDQTAHLHHSPPQTVVLSSGEVVEQQEWPSTTSSFEAGLSSTCSAVKHRGIDWPPTVAGSLAIRPCPQDASGMENI